MNPITVEKTAEDSASKSLQVTVPVDRVREAEAKALKYYVQRARLPGFRPGKAPDGGGPQAVRRRHPADGAGRSHPGELGDGQDQPSRSSRSPIPPSATSSSRKAARSSSSCTSRCGPSSSSSGSAGSGSSGSVAPVADAAVEEQLARMQEQKAAWIPVEGSQADAGPDGPGGGGPDRGRRGRRGPAVRSRAGREPGHPRAGGADHDARSRAKRPTPRCSFPTTSRTRRGGARPAGSASTLQEVKRQELPAARRRVRARGRRLRDPRRAARGGAGGPRARGRPRGRRPGAAAADRPDRRGQPSRRRDRWCTG